VDALANDAGVFDGKPFTDYTCAMRGPNFAGAAGSVQPGHRPRISPARHATLLLSRDFRVGRQANPALG
jgi:hypothetical protein